MDFPVVVRDRHWQLVYTSRSNVPVDHDLIHKIQQASCVRNDRLGVTGFLLVCRDMFLQLVEGEAYAVEDVFSMIESDPSHDEIDVIFNRQVPRLCAPSWGMGVIYPGEQRGAPEEPAVVSLYEQALVYHGLPDEVRTVLRGRLAKATTQHARAGARCASHRAPCIRCVSEPSRDMRGQYVRAHHRVSVRPDAVPCVAGARPE